MSHIPAETVTERRLKFLPLALEIKKILKVFKKEGHAAYDKCR